MTMIRWTYVFNTPWSSVESQSGSPVTPYKYYSIHYRTVDMSFNYICRTIEILEKSGKHQMGNCDFNMKRCCTSSTVQINLGNIFPEKFPGKTWNKENSENGVSSIWSISSSCNRLKNFYKKVRRIRLRTVKKVFRKWRGRIESWTRFSTTLFASRIWATGVEGEASKWLPCFCSSFWSLESF